MNNIRNKKFNLIKSGLGQGAVLISSLALPTIIATETKAMFTNKSFTNNTRRNISQQIQTRPPLGGQNSIYGRMLSDSSRSSLLPSQGTRPRYVAYDYNNFHTVDVGPHSGTITTHNSRNIQSTDTRTGSSYSYSRNIYTSNSGPLGNTTTLVERTVTKNKTPYGGTITSTTEKYAQDSNSGRAYFTLHNSSYTTD